MTITKKQIGLNLIGLVVAFIAQIFLLLSAQYYKASETNIAFGFFAFALALLFIVLFVIFPMFLKNDF